MFFNEFIILVMHSWFKNHFYIKDIIIVITNYWIAELTKEISVYRVYIKDSTDDLKKLKCFLVTVKNNYPKSKYLYICPKKWA